MQHSKVSELARPGSRRQGFNGANGIMFQELARWNSAQCNRQSPLLAAAPPFHALWVTLPRLLLPFGGRSACPDRAGPYLPLGCRGVLPGCFRPRAGPSIW
ncbi:hypothetical protein CKAH01_15941 [Colletotrichum kahawae]|uniref:Uncharacterized protein n=1 Tax=Colletotrichum kahawae TaxID=34407 RepID=A0AAE0D675_COLKA|nr:hypothetical protein CKAH01_15941 [Colletotrichum kahawae]